MHKINSKNKSNTPSKRLMTQSEVAQRLRVSTETVRRYTRQGRLRAISLTARTVRYLESDFEAFIEKGLVLRREK